MPANQKPNASKGVLYALAAYTMWGIAPVYFKLISEVPPLEILAHRIIWSFIMLALLIVLGSRWQRVKQICSNRRQLSYLLLTSLFIAINWLIYIWAVNNGHMLDASLGYYINPLVNVLLGMIFLGERLRKWQWVAVGMASCGVVIQLLILGSVPVVAIALAVTFGIYGLLRKKIAVEAQSGLFIETAILLPVALLYLLFFAHSPTANLANNSLQLNILLVAAGIVTTLPLLCFNAAATSLKLSTLGFFQYIAPSLVFVQAVLFYAEPLSSGKAITFAFIWGALLIFTVDGIRLHRQLPSRRSGEG